MTDTVDINQVLLPDIMERHSFLVNKKINVIRVIISACY